MGWTVGAVDTGDNSLLSFLTRTEGAAETVSVMLDSCFTVVTILDTTELELDKRKTMWWIPKIIHGCRPISDKFPLKSIVPKRKTRYKSFWQKGTKFIAIMLFLCFIEKYFNKSSMLLYTISYVKRESEGFRDHITSHGDLQFWSFAI